MSKEFKRPERVIYVCCDSKCKKKGGKEISKMYKQLIKDHKLKEKVALIKTECTDNCKLAPVMSFQPQNQWYVQVSEEEAKAVFEENILKHVSTE